MEWLILILIFGGPIVAWVLISRLLKKKRRAALLEKYGDEKIVDMIMRRMFWQGQTEPQLIDSLGQPADIDKKVYKAKTKDTWKYHQTGKNRFGLRITVEDGIVVGWDQKD